MRNKEAERLGISEETLDSMKRFFLKHAIPNLMEKRREAEKLEEETQNEVEGLEED